MKYYEVIIKIIRCGRTLKRTIMFVSAVTAIDAAYIAESKVDNMLNNDSYSKVEKVNSIDEQAYKFITAA